MASKKAASILMLALIFCAGLGGYLVSQQTGVTPPSKHAALVQKMSIQVTGHELPIEVYLNPKCVDAGSRTFAKYMTVNFQVGKDYDESTWIWQRYGDTELSMQVWGPGEDGQTCIVGIGKLGNDAFTVMIAGNKIPNIPLSDGITNTNGYYALFVKIS